MARSLREIVVATTNPGKMTEIRAVFGPLGVGALSLNEVATEDGSKGSALAEPEETGLTFEANAAIKARAYAAALARVCLAEDSGLEVDALGGAPGVRSARYAGVGASRGERDAANNEKLLREMESVTDGRRSARFVCAVCVASPGGEILAESRGELQGAITRAARGGGGFGYDPLFLLPDGRTSAELSREEKNSVSHRGAACRAIAPRLVAALAG